MTRIMLESLTMRLVVIIFSHHQIPSKHFIYHGWGSSLHVFHDDSEEHEEAAYYRDGVKICGVYKEYSHKKSILLVHAAICMGFLTML